MNIAQLKAERARIDALIEAASAPVLVKFPESHIDLAPGEVYRGIILKDGAPSYHLILLPEVAKEKTWEQAMEWAAKLGGAVPSKAEWLQIMRSVGSLVADGNYWADKPTYNKHAWYIIIDRQSYAHQGDMGRSHELMARAVRRVPI